MNASLSKHTSPDRTCTSDSADHSDFSSKVHAANSPDQPRTSHAAEYSAPSHMGKSSKNDPVCELLTESEEQTMAAASDWARNLKAGDVVLLKGPLGAGKTRFAKGVAARFQVEPDQVQSPTFSLLHEYEGTLPVWHMDAYRLDNALQARQAGLEEYLFGEGICLVEWPERMQGLFEGLSVWTVVIEALSESQRKISIYKSPELL